jgi:hypothetical protein
VAEKEKYRGSGTQLGGITKFDEMYEGGEIPVRE